MSIASDEAAIRKATHDWTRPWREECRCGVVVLHRGVVAFDLASPLKHAGFDRKMPEGSFKTWGTMPRAATNACRAQDATPWTASFASTQFSGPRLQQHRARHDRLDRHCRSRSH